MSEVRRNGGMGCFVRVGDAMKQHPHSGDTGGTREHNCRLTVIDNRFEVECLEPHEHSELEGGNKKPAMVYTNECKL